MCSARRKMLAVLTVLCLTAAQICAQGQKTSQLKLERDFQAAMAAQEKGDLDGAMNMLLALRQQYPGIFAINESLGLLYVEQERFTEALPLLQAAAREQPDSDVAHANLGAALFKLHRNEEALAEFQLAARLNPDNATTQQSLGELWLDSGRPDKAVDAFLAALRLNPADKDLILSYATALVAAKRFDEAERALSSIPNVDLSAPAQLMLGEIDEGKRNFESAAKHFSRAVELDPSEANAWALGLEFLRHWTFGAAVSEFEAATQKFPTSTRMKLGLGAAYFGDGKYAEAIPVFADLLNGDPNSALYAEMLGMACSAVSNSAKKPCAVLVSYAESHPQDARAATYAASMLLIEAGSEDHSELALKLLKNAMAAEPELPDAQYQMGVLKQNQGDWTGSISNLEAAIALKPDFSQAHYRLALAYWRTGRKRDGQAEMELQKKHSKQEKEDLDRRLRQITTFIVDVRQ